MDKGEEVMSRVVETLEQHPGRQQANREWEICSKQLIAETWKRESRGNSDGLTQEPILDWGLGCFFL